MMPSLVKGAGADLGGGGEFRGFEGSIEPPKLKQLM